MSWFNKTANPKVSNQAKELRDKAVELHDQAFVVALRSFRENKAIERMRQRNSIAESINMRRRQGDDFRNYLG